MKPSFKAVKSQRKAAANQVSDAHANMQRRLTGLNRTDKTQEGKRSIFLAILLVVEEEVAIFASIVVSDIGPTDVSPGEEFECNNVPNNAFWVVRNRLRVVSWESEKCMQNDLRASEYVH